MIKQQKGKVDLELKDIWPEVEAARTAVGDLKSDNLNEIKAFWVPPDAVHDVLGAVLVMMGEEDTTWNNMKKFLTQRGVIQAIIQFDAHNVTKDIRNQVGKIIDKKKNSFNADVIAGVSWATAPLAAWVVANIKYSQVLLQIEPLERELNKLQKQLDESTKRANDCIVQLEELDEQTKILNKELMKKTSEAEALKMDLKKAEDTLVSA